MCSPGKALACYLLSLAVGLFCIAAPFVAALAAPAGAAAEGNDPAAAAEQPAVDKPQGNSAAAGEGEEELVPEKLVLAAYPLTDDGSWDTSAEKLTTIDTRGGQLRILIGVTWSDGKRIYENQAKWDDRAALLGEGWFTYESSDNGVITPAGSTGVVRAVGDGEATITVTPGDERFSGLAKKIKFKVTNQTTGLLVTKIQIVDENNTAYGDDAVKLTDSTSLTKLYARITYKDLLNDNAKVVYSNAPGAPASERPESDSVFDSVSWQVGDTDYASVANHGGVASLKGIASAMTSVFVTVTGGKESKDYGFGYGVMYDRVTVRISNGKTVGGEQPADSLKVKIVYENDLKTVVKKETFSKEQFEALGAITRTYTMTRAGGKYVTDRAYGVPLATILQHFELSANDVKYMRLAANDGANPGKLSAKFLLKTTRYYLPNYDLGGSWQEKEQVPTMIALKDSWNQDTMVTGELNPGTCFRLVFGAATKSDGVTDKSIKFINTMTIVMKGAPASSHGKEEKSDTPKQTAVATKKPQGGSGGTGSSGEGKGNGSGKAKGPAMASGTQGDGGKVSGVAPASTTSQSEEAPWRIFEMMNKSESNLPLRFLNNPLAPYLWPAFGILLIMAATSRYALFRRRLA